MRYLSVCSGIEAATVAWHPLGWTPVAFSEIAAFPSAVLAHHYPTTPNWGDLTQYAHWPTSPVDLVVGGTPCQSFSVAGFRAGLADPRGNLALTFCGAVDKYRPEWVVWENVPGVLSSNRGRDFGAFVGGLAELGYGWAYRVLDAQYFGVAQRRRRVFVVGCLGGWQRAAAVLFDAESLSGHPAPRRDTQQTIAAPLADSPDACSKTPTDVDRPWEVPVAFAHQAGGKQTTLGATANLCQTLGANQTPAIVVMAPTPLVRRLTPRECERLQGFPDDYTAIPWRNKAAARCPDGIRYKALGNSMAVPVMRWIGARIAAAQTLRPPARNADD